MNASSLVATYGYPAVLLGAVVEGEAVVVAAGYLAHRAHLPLWPVVACAAAGATIGDQGFFLLGRKGGERAVARLPPWLRARIERARDAVARRPVRVLLSMRFLYGMRIALPILMGTSAMSASRFVRYNVATAIAWALLFASVGYLFGAAATAAIHEVERYDAWLLGAIVVLVIVFHTIAARRAPRT